MKNSKKSSTKIGTFITDKDGILHGKIYGLGLGVTSVMFDPQTSRDGKAYFRLIADPIREAYEIGVAFPRDKDGAAYHFVTIDSPALPAPINAALFQDRENGSYNLVWNRQEEGNALKVDATVNSNGQSRYQGSAQSRWNQQQPSPV